MTQETALLCTINKIMQIEEQNRLPYARFALKMTLNLSKSTKHIMWHEIVLCNVAWETQACKRDLIPPMHASSQDARSPSDQS